MCLLENDLVELHFGSPLFFVSVEAFQDVFYSKDDEYGEGEALVLILVVMGCFLLL